MTSTDTNVQNLVINKLASAHYSTITPSSTELYMVTDEAITSSDVITALGYTPYSASNPSGYTSNVGTVTSVNNVSPVSGNVTSSIPTDTADLTNGAGYITSSALSPYALTADLAAVVTSGSYADFVDYIADLYNSDTYTIYAYVYNDGTDDYTIYADSATTPTELYNYDGSSYTGSDFTVSSGVVYYSSNTCTYASADNVEVTNLAYFTDETSWQWL